MRPGETGKLWVEPMRKSFCNTFTFPQSPFLRTTSGSAHFSVSNYSYASAAFHKSDQMQL